MSYIGNPPAEAYTNTVKDSFSGDGSTVAFTLSRPSLTNDVRVVVENVIQDPTVAYSVSGTTLTFTSAPPSGTNNIYVVHLGPAVQTAVPPGEISAATTFASNVTVQGAFTSRGIDDNATSTAMTLASGGDITMTDGLTVDNDGATVLTVDRATSYGPLIELQRNGSTFADIGVTSFSGTSVGRPYFTNHSEDGFGIHYINSSNAAIVPIRANAEIDDAGYLGHTNHRWKDLYLSGGVYLGGTGAANYLDDYEEGTFSTYLFDAETGGNFVALGTGYYSKVGNIVNFNFADSNVSTSGLTGTNAAFFKLPFVSGSNFSGPMANILMRDVNWAGTQTSVSSYLGDGQDTFRIYVQGDNVAYTSLKINEIGSGAGDFYISGTYRTAS